MDDQVESFAEFRERVLGLSPRQQQIAYLEWAAQGYKQAGNLSAAERLTSMKDELSRLMDN